MSVRGSKTSSFFSAFSSYLFSGNVSKCKMKSSEGLSIAVSNQYPEVGFQSSLSQKSDDDLHLSDSNHAAIDDGIRKELENLDVKYCNETEDITFGGEEAEDGGKREVGEGGGNGDEKIEENCMKENDDEDGSEDESDRENLSGGGDDNDDDEVEKNVERNGKKYPYPVRPDAEDCAYYLKNGTCKFGPSCKFNHPIRSKNQATKGKLKDHEDSSDKRRHTECKFYSKTGGCKFGKACRYNHTRAKISVGPVLELNFLGLPIRPDEKKCPYFMRTGSCKYGPNCKFNHPDPITVDASETSSGYGNGGSGSLHISSQPPISSWSSLRMVNETAPFVPVMLTPTQPQEWNGYQAPVYPSVPPPSYPMSNPATEAHDYKPQHQHMRVEDFPERPGYPECSYFMKTGDCKFKSQCKYHHPKQSAPCNLSNKGLPLRPEQNVCSYYSRYGICKFGPACKFNHPINLSAATGFGGNDQDPRFGNSNSSTETAIIYGGGGANAL